MQRPFAQVDVFTSVTQDPDGTILVGGRCVTVVSGTVDL